MLSKSYYYAASNLYDFKIFIRTSISISLSKAQNPKQYNALCLNVVYRREKYVIRGPR